ncbi:Hypothetical protein R9X50_00650600 [Acrodontium crateriforme]|uniref:CWH43-like N-terminal domain-containing protein n=1 Tax=Acrodontium crateriforme TaxID=150365 RepID=A0AAQ3MB34_9PEZI|nr:Hypothetical protein R9X50_00650600 [Acrodontium crateriforme]
MLGLSYWFLPLFAGCAWLGTLIAMLAVWTAEGKPHYVEEYQSQHIPFISDIGASGVKPLFIAGSATMVVVFDLAFISERWLRHKGRLAHNYNITEKILSGFAIAFAIIGACGLIFLSIFDTKRYPTVHQSMLGVFIGGYVISAVFICSEYQRLGIHFREHRILRISFWIKLAFIFIEISLAIAFGVLQYQRKKNRAAILEWLVSFIFIFYVWSFIIDFLPATQTKHREHRFPPVKREDDEMAMTTQAEGNMTGGPVYSNGGYRNGVTDSYGSQQPIAQQGSVAASRNF